MKSISEADIMAVVGSSPGQPYSDLNVASDRDNILALYFNEGFPNAAFTWTAAPAGGVETKTKGAKVAAADEPEAKIPDGEGTSKVDRAEPVKLIYKIVEGPQIRVRRVF